MAVHLADVFSTEDLLVNLSETRASASALSCDLAFDLGEELLADRVHGGVGQPTATSR
ncbi:DUF6124 family protein [Pseudomonas cyclaminis]|uniref:DUF6124 family protein n=1 Tax=Pseudomonas cyclaminis TaxID=2781239 RepID=UPI0037F13AA2